MCPFLLCVDVAKDEVPFPEGHNCIDGVTKNEYCSIPTCLWEEKHVNYISNIDIYLLFNYCRKSMKGVAI